MARYKYLVILQFLLTFCLCDINLEEKVKLVNGFVKFYNSLPNQAYICEQGYLLNAQHTDISNAYNIDVNLKVSDAHNTEVTKYLKCSATVANIDISTVVFEPGVVVLSHECHEDGRPNENPANVEEVTEQVAVTEPMFNRKPIQLDNEVQTNTAVTSGEQFIAVPREEQKKHCIGCSSHINPQAEGVTELAAIGIRQLNSLEPNIQHSLNSVVDVERQVQVVNGVRYILTLLVDYNSCPTSQAHEPCITSNACKITILEKPWMQLSDGTKFRAILSNNCTEEWRFGDDGVVVPNAPNNNRDENTVNSSNGGNSDDIIKSVQFVNVQSQPKTEKTLTENDIKNIQDQIIPNDQVQSYVEHSAAASVSSALNPVDESKDHIEKVETQTLFSPNAIQQNKPHKVEGLEDDKKKAIDDLINFFNFADVDSNNHDEMSRVKRSFHSDLHVLNIAEKYRKLKNSINNSKHIYFLAQAVVDYMNEIDLEVKNRILKDVINAEKESENENHFFYIQFRTVIPCDRSVCENENKSIKLCNAIIDNSEKDPQILNVFCHDEDIKRLLGNVNIVPEDDPVLLKLIADSIDKIEKESSNDIALRLSKVIEATTQKVSGTVTKVSLVLDEINCKKTVPMSLRINCTVVEKAGSKICDVTIYERHWIKEREITYSCIDRPIDIIFSKTDDGVKKSISDPKVRDILQDALRYLDEQSNVNNKQVIVSILSVSTQLVAGFLTKVEFVAGYTSCAADVKIEDSSNCKLLENKPLKKCTAKVWDRAWIEEDANKFQVLCKESNVIQKRKKLSTHAKVKIGELEEDANNPQYKALAEESLKKYLQDSGNTQPHSVTHVDRVTTQVVAGSLTRIDFTIAPVSSSADTISCKSEIWERPWLNDTENKIITVKCKIDDLNKRAKRGVPGGEIDLDPTDPKYKALAEESMKKYLQDSGNSQSHSVTRVDKVTTQVVAGSLTKIDFTIAPVSSSADTISCKSKIWERPWLNNSDKKIITVECKINDSTKRAKRGVPGGETDVDPTDPKYKALAEESMKKYLQDSGNSQSHSVTRVDKVTTQVVAGSLTKIDFTIAPLSSSADTISCKSEIWERPWLNDTENKIITVKCKIDDLNKRAKRGVPGGEIDLDPTDPKYKALAEESMKKYLQDSGNSQSHSVTRVDKVTTQVVAGSLTKIDFTIAPVSSSADTISCKSKIWERPWLNNSDKKIITVECKINDSTKRAKRGVPGGETDVDPTDPKYKALAEESMKKYLQDSGNSRPHSVTHVDRVTTRVVDGSLTVIDFTIAPVSSSADTISCISKIWERSWLNKKDIEVHCKINTSKNRQKRNIIKGGLKEQDPNRPTYRILAERSLAQYLSDIGNKELHNIVSIEKVTTQVVSGTITNINFKIAPEAMATNIMSCKSSIWEQPWLNKTEIDVNCKYNQEHKREIRTFSSNKKRVGAVQEEDPSKSEYKELAEKSLTKYRKNQDNLKFHVVAEVKKVTAQIVSGFRYTIDFVAAPRSCAHDVTTCDDISTVLNCHSIVKDQPWLSHKEIVVSCNSPHARNKRVPLESNIKKNLVLTELSANYISDLSRHQRKRQANEDEVEDDIKFYYGDRAIQHLNTDTKSKNLHKIITIHAIQSSVQMDNTPMVRMYLEVAETFCLRHYDEDRLSECEEMDAMNHKLCLARLWPSPEDEMIVHQVSIVCDDDDKFESVSGISMQNLLKASLETIEKPRQMLYKLVHLGEPHLIPSLDSGIPFKLNFIIGTTNCSKKIESYKKGNCYLDTTKPSKACTSYIWMVPNSRTIDKINAKCGRTESRQKRSITLDTRNATVDDLLIQKLVQESLDKLEMSTPQRYKQNVLSINSFSTKVTSGKVTTIDFDVGFTSCLKYAWVDDVSTCELLEHLPRRRCVSQIWERLWLENGKNIEVTCKDEDEPLEAHVEFESAALAKALAHRALKHIEAKYPHPRKQKVVRIFSLVKQVVAGVHYRMKLEVATTNCSALSRNNITYCKPTSMGGSENKFCTVNVWMRPWTDHPPNYRVTCDYQDGAMAELYHQVQAEHLFREFIATYMPDYMNDHENLSKRFEIFRANVLKMHELNTHERGTASYGVTRFADLTYEEFTTKHMGLKQSLRDVNQVPMRKAVIPKVDIPDKFDWREQGAVTEVKNQGSCGSCWAFSVTGNIEGQWKLKSGKLVSLSEQELVDCDKMDDGCNGGLPDNAYRAIEQLGGLETDNDYPYEGEDDKCAFNKTLSKVQISGAVNISSNETDMAKWLVSNGPISIGINANAMQFYMGGVSHPWKMLCSPNNLDHGVLIVGYGIKNYPLFHKRLPYWIVKNSWGPTWGEQGYYRVYRGDGTCGVNQMASSALI